MTHVPHRKLWVALIAILGFVFSSNVAFADYVAFQNRLPIPAPALTADPQYQMFGGDWVIEFVATNTITQFDRIDFPLCRYNGTIGGEIQLEIRSTASTTGIIIASSTLAVNDGNVAPPSSGCITSGYINATSSTFVLNNNIQTISGVTWWIRLRFVGTAGVIYNSMQNRANWDNNGTVWTDGGSSPFTYSGTTYSMAMIGRSLGVQPTGGIVDYNASSTVVVCSTFDVGCYFSAGLSWAFTLSDDSFEGFITLKDDLKDHAPFGYFTAAAAALGDLSTSTTPDFALDIPTPIMDIIFTPLRIALVAIVFLAGLIWLYKRLTQIVV